jgi:hypothetical protein
MAGAVELDESYRTESINAIGSSTKLRKPGLALCDGKKKVAPDFFPAPPFL